MLVFPAKRAEPSLRKEVVHCHVNIQTSEVAAAKAAGGLPLLAATISWITD